MGGNDDAFAFALEAAAGPDLTAVGAIGASAARVFLYKAAQAAGTKFATSVMS